jgi:hypothetical protein
VNRWYATANPQHMLPGSADVLAFGTTRRVDSEQISKPAPGEAPMGA